MNVVEDQLKPILHSGRNLYSKKLYEIHYKKRKASRWVISHLNPMAAPERDEIVKSLVIHTASLELLKEEFIELAPMSGTTGTIRLSGNSLPVFEYRVFEKAMMEFIKVRVEIARPQSIRFICTIDSEGTQDPARHGEEVPCLPKYEAPFHKLSIHLFNYFPYYKKKL